MLGSPYLQNATSGLRRKRSDQYTREQLLKEKNSTPLKDERQVARILTRQLVILGRAGAGNVARLEGTKSLRDTG